MNIESFDLSEKFVVIDSKLKAHQEPLRSTLYQELDEKYEQFKSCELMSIHDFTESWQTWECHPCGDEVLVLLAGEIEFLLRVNGETQVVGLSEVGQSLVVPKGLWHTARVSTMAKVLFLTPGEKTENRADLEVPHR